MSNNGAAIGTAAGPSAPVEGPPAPGDPLVMRESRTTDRLPTEDVLMGRPDPAGLSPADLTALVRFTNRIVRERVPVKCVLIALRAIVRLVPCELVELCHLDADANLVVNYMMREMILHRREIGRPQGGAFGRVFAEGTPLVVADATVGCNIEANDNHTDVKIQSAVIVPLRNAADSVWGVIAIINYGAGGARAAANGTGCPAGAVGANGGPPTEPSTPNGPTGATTPSGAEPQFMPLLTHIAHFVGLFLSHVAEFAELEISRDKSNSLLTLMHSLFSDQLGIQSCIISLTTHARKLIQAESCTVYIVDNKRGQLWSISSNSGDQIVFPLDGEAADSASVLRRCVAAQSPIVFDRNYNNGKDFNQRNVVVIGVEGPPQGGDACPSGAEGAPQGPTASNGAPTVPAGIRNGIWMPIKNGSSVLAVIEVVNKQNRELLHFSEEDLNLLELFSVIVAPQFERSEFSHMATAHRATEAGLAFENVQYGAPDWGKNFINQSIIEEENEL